MQNWTFEIQNLITFNLWMVHNSLSAFTGLEENEDDLFMDYTMLPASKSETFDVQFVEKQTLFIKRWKPDQLKVKCLDWLNLVKIKYFQFKR